MDKNLLMSPGVGARFAMIVSRLREKGIKYELKLFRRHGCRKELYGLDYICLQVPDEKSVKDLHKWMAENEIDDTCDLFLPSEGKNIPGLTVVMHVRDELSMSEYVKTNADKLMGYFKEQNIPYKLIPLSRDRDETKVGLGCINPVLPDESALIRLKNWIEECGLERDIWIKSSRPNNDPVSEIEIIIPEEIIMTPPERYMVDMIEGYLKEQGYPYRFERVGYWPKSSPLKYICAGIPDKKCVLELKEWLKARGENFACVVDTSKYRPLYLMCDTMDLLSVKIYTSRERFENEYLLKTLEPFTMINPEILSISGGETRVFLFFDQEEQKTKCMERFRNYSNIDAIYDHIEEDHIDAWVMSEMGINFGLHAVF